MRVVMKAEIDSGNAAFQDDPIAQVQHILGKATKSLNVDVDDSQTITLKDHNGNRVGFLTITLEND